MVLQVVHCSIQGRSLPYLKELDHFSSVRAARHESEASSYRDTEISLSGSSLSQLDQSQCLAVNYHYPHHCEVPDCAFMVAWREKDEETVVFNLTVKVTEPTMVWAAIGFSEDAKMVKYHVQMHTSLSLSLFLSIFIFSLAT